MKPAVHGTSIICTPGTIDLSNGCPRINQTKRDEGEQRENGAYHVALLTANFCTSDRLWKVFIPERSDTPASLHNRL
jgi:hypothetical protein